MSKADRLLAMLNDDIRRCGVSGDLRRKTVLEQIRHELCGLSGDARELFAVEFLEALCGIIDERNGKAKP